MYANKERTLSSLSRYSEPATKGELDTAIDRLEFKIDNPYTGLDCQRKEIAELKREIWSLRSRVSNIELLERQAARLQSQVARLQRRSADHHLNLLCTWFVGMLSLFTIYVAFLLFILPRLPSPPA